jgi:proteic killer suppression protein
MIINFADKETEKLFLTGSSRKLPQSIIKRACQMLDILDKTIKVEYLMSPPSYRLHSLSGDLQGFWSISINMQWRIIFRFKDADAYDVEITDYH